MSVDICKFKPATLGVFAAHVAASGCIARTESHAAEQVLEFDLNQDNPGTVILVLDWASTKVFVKTIDKVVEAVRAHKHGTLFLYDDRGGRIASIDHSGLVEVYDNGAVKSTWQCPHRARAAALADDDSRRLVDADRLERMLRSADLDGEYAALLQALEAVKAEAGEKAYRHL